MDPKMGIFIVELVVVFLVSKLSGTVPRHVQEMIESVRFPKGADAAAAGH